jgi:divalent metal cation (Fe/Co/Zn/Cd) transporter
LTNSSRPSPVRALVGRISRRISTAVHMFNFRVFMTVGTLYVAAGSFIGFESLAMLIAYTTIWPVAIPITIVGIGLVGLIVAVLRRRGREAAAYAEPAASVDDPRG